MDIQINETMNRFLCVESENVTSKVSEQQFWKGVNVWIRSPHVENRRLCGVKTIVSARVLEPLNSSHIVEQIIYLLNNHKDVIYDDNASVRQGLEIVGIKLGPSEVVDFPSGDAIVVKVRELIPKNATLFQPCREAIVLDGKQVRASFIHLGPFQDNLSPRTPYSCCFKQESGVQGGILEFALWMDDTKKVTEEGADTWLKSKLFPRLLKWIVLEHNANSTLPETSLNLVDLNHYNDKYQELKKKYGQQMVEIWPEQTDPLKFVYEDLAIASYLLCLWGCGADGKKVSFIDLGCGNGLLVHILSSEGHPGLGLDVRSRKLWALYPSTTQLKVCSVTPSPDTTFPEYDWIIGNHSDELTPWIPVMTALSAPQTSYFLLPCCAHDFWGKYQRLDTSTSQYTEYIKFVRNVGETCGFKVEIDKLRIPSTKRTCLIGRHRFKSVEKTVIWEYVTSRKQNGQEDFIPKPTQERVRNCTKLASGITENVLKLITEHLLSGFDKSEDWWAGKDLSLAEAASLLPASLRAALKSECGGLQTLLRNHHNIFIVQSGVVKFRRPTPSNKYVVPKWKNKPCWFFLNHPQRCPLQEDECSFDHRKSA